MQKRTSQRILVIEDEEDLRLTLKLNLREQGYKVLLAADGHDGIEKALTKNPDLIILDLMLPGMDGLSLVHQLRPQSDVPILILTARTLELDKIIGLESGADDYLTKPFSVGELMARVRALLRRVQTSSSREILRSGGVVLDLVSRQAACDERPLNLSPKEFSLLAELIRNEGAVLSRDLLLARVWGYDYIGDQRTVDVHIRWLREKLEDDPSNPTLIQTVRGIGYRYGMLDNHDGADD